MLAALHVLRTAPGAEVAIVEPAARLASGAAFGTPDPAHLLNVPAAGMSAFPDEPEDFLEWLEGESVTGEFVPRALFGSYLRDRLDAAALASDGRLDVARGEVVRIAREDGATAAELADGRVLRASSVLLATGPPRRLRPAAGAEALSGHRGFVADPWQPGALARIRRGDRVLLVGTGLTMADVALTLADRGVELVAVSRRGLVPLAHPEHPPERGELPLPGGLGPLVRAIRRGAAAGEHWSAALEALRPDTQLLWNGLSSVEQDRFLRHAAPYWNVHRHRLPPATAYRLGELLAAHRLEVLAGRIGHARRDGDGIRVSVVGRRTQEETTLRVAHVVSCSGPARLADEAPALVRSLLASGLARLDPHGIGLDTSPAGRLLDRTGRASASLFAVGALRRGTLWESTAIPEIRTQAAAFAQVVAGAGHASRR